MLKTKNYFVHCVLTFSVVLVFSACNAQIMNDKKIPETPVIKNESKTIIKAENSAKEEQKAQEPKEENSAVAASENVKKDKEEEQEEQEEEQDLMEKALDLMEVADNYWEKGDVENTLNILDKAYNLILETNGDAAVARQKDDLRLLISRRILTVYSAKQSATNGKASEIPLIMNPDVEKEIRSFQGQERDFFISSFQRSGMYRPIIIKELKKAGLPEELSWLPLVESGFKILALSRARALGLWQFIPSTGYKYGLNRDEWIDERMDVEKSTQAAIAYLKELHGMFGDWLTVLAAYNSGEGRVLRVISSQHINYFDRFWDLYYKLPNETARYVPRFLATLHIIKDPKKYGMDLGSYVGKPVNYEFVKANKVMKLQDIAAKLEVSEDTLVLLNSELRYKITPDREYDLKVPAASVARYNSVTAEIPESEKPKFAYGRMVSVRHRVRSGETLSSIAKRYKVSVSTIASYNNISSKKGLVAGQRLKIPIYRTASLPRSKKAVKINRAQASMSQSKNMYRVKRGDTLLNIARRFAIPVNQLKEINNLEGNSIRIGQVLKISAAEVSSAAENKNNAALKEMKKQQIAGQTLSAADVEKLGTNKYIVTRGDNLSIIAKKNNINVAELAKLTRLSVDETLTPGQILIIK
jgi:membrane-bound lytic murein transglycosylase D